MKAFVSDPAARKEQQLARLAARREAQADERAIERMEDDLKAGRNLSATDIRNLTHEHQLQLSAFGDDGVRQMVDDARRQKERDGKGEDRHREW